MSTSSSRRSESENDASVCSSPDAEALIVASGVRKSCDTACSNAARSALASDNRSAFAASTRSRRASTAIAN